MSTEVLEPSQVSNTPDQVFKVVDKISGNILPKPCFTAQDYAIHHSLCHELKKLFNLLITNAPTVLINTYIRQCSNEIINIMNKYSDLFNKYSIYNMQYEYAKAMVNYISAITTHPDTVEHEMQKLSARKTEINKHNDAITGEFQQMVTNISTQFKMLFNTLCIKMRAIGIANQIIYARQIQEEREIVENLQKQFALREVKLKENTVKRDTQHVQDTEVPNNKALRKAKQRRYKNNYYAFILRKSNFDDILSNRITTCKFASEIEFKYAVESVGELTDTFKHICIYIHSLLKSLKNVPGT